MQFFAQSPAVGALARGYQNLTEEQIQRSCAYGRTEDYRVGQTLLHRGTRAIDFLIALSGSLELVGKDVLGADVVFGVLEAGEFVGQPELLTARASLISVRASTDTKVLRIPHKEVRRFAAAEQDIADLLVRAILARHAALMEDSQLGATIVGEKDAEATLYLEEFLVRNGYPCQSVQPAAASTILEQFQIGTSELPVVIAGGEAFRQPKLPYLADALGMTEDVTEGTCDVAIVGAGPAGLSASVYAASEGLNAVVVDAVAPGGQAGASSRIENYLGFPTGLSGDQLATLAQIQAQKFGARFAVSRAVRKITPHDEHFILDLDGGHAIHARSVIIASGARYRRLSVVNYAKYERSGIHYAATTVEAGLCGWGDVVVVGGGNSAGQAAEYLSAYARTVYLLVRGASLSKSMSNYLVRRVEMNSKISVQLNSEVVALSGEHKLQQVTWSDRSNGRTTQKPTQNLFVMIGADPCTAWLADLVNLDSKGFVLTGSDVSASNQFQTSKPGVFAVGDVRAGNVKRVASSVGEGSVVISNVSAYLKSSTT